MCARWRMRWRPYEFLPKTSLGRNDLTLSPRIVLPFLAVVMIWGSTWIVIKDGLGVVPAPWSVTYRFGIAAAAMFALVAARRQRLWLSGGEWGFALAIGLFQFVLNFNFVYAAEGHVTSGLVSLVFALLMVPNAALSRWWLKTPITGGFLAGSAIAIVGVALLFVVEARRSGVGEDVPLGIALTLGGVLAASVANVMQATPTGRAAPMLSVLAWAMLFGAIGDGAVALAWHGAPVWEARAGYWAGVVYLAVFASAVAFPLYFGLIRVIGPGKAAYASLIVPVVAMGLSTVFEGYRWTPLAVGGGVLAAIGLVIALRSREPRTPRATG